MKKVLLSVLILVITTIPVQHSKAADSPTPGSYAQWKNGPVTDSSYFPLAVWLQDPARASEWKKVGINLYIGLWKGPTLTQLDQLRDAGMQVICKQNEVALSYTKTLDDGRPVIVGWLMPDEPDNAQRKPGGGYGPPMPTAMVQELAKNVRANDSTRPIFQGIGMGISTDTMTWKGQGGKIVPERDYPEYLAAADIVAFDVYPVSGNQPDIHRNLWRVPLGLDRLKKFAPPNAIVWNHIETSDIGARGPEYTPTPAEIRTEVWMSIIHGSRGIDYFIHGKSNTPKFDSIALLRPENAERLEAVKNINREILELAPIINSTQQEDTVKMHDAEGTAHVDFMTRVYHEALCLFAVAMRDEATRKTFSIDNWQNGSVKVIGEDRTIPLQNGKFTDSFGGYATHLYEIKK